MIKEEAKALCEWLKVFRLSDGYANYLNQCVDDKNAKLHNFKGHDFHIFMEKLLPITLRDFLPPNV